MAKKLYICFIVWFAINAATASAQETVCASGGDAHGNGTISFSVGQPFYIVSDNNNGSLTPGVQQSYLITPIETAVSEINPFISMNVYPNPTTDLLTLSINNETSLNLHYTLTDDNGRSLEKSPVETSLTEIDMSRYTPSVYFINVFSGKSRLKSFKIVKIQ